MILQGSEQFGEHHFVDSMTTHAATDSEEFSPTDKKLVFITLSPVTM